MRFFADGNLCVGLLVVGGFIWFPLHMTMVWYLARRAGILALSDTIDVCVSKHQSSLIRGDRDSQLHHRAASPRTYATKQMSESHHFLHKQEKRRAPSNKRSDLLTVGGAKFKSKERSDVAIN